MRRLRVPTLVVVLLGASSPLPVARADPLATPALHWSRSENAGACIDPATLAERVEQLTGASLSRPAQAQRMIEGHIESTAPQRYRARVTASERGQSPSGQRVLEQEAKDCRELDGALVFIVAMMVDPSLSLAGLPPELLALVSSEVPADGQLLAELEQNRTATNTPPPPQEPASSSAQDVVPGAEPALQLPEPPKSEPPASLPPGKYELRAMALAEFQVAPEPLLGIQLMFGAELAKYWSLVVSLRGASGVGPMGLPESDTGSVKAQAFDATLGACAGAPAEERFRMRGCLGLDYSLWRQKGAGFESDRAAVLSGVGVSLGLDGTLRVRGGFGISAVGAARVNTLERRFVYDDSTLGFSVPRLSYLVSLGPSYRF
jgi:hypothetical protein